jgi:hypothetical protein
MGYNRKKTEKRVKTEKKIKGGKVPSDRRAIKEALRKVA